MAITCPNRRRGNSCAKGHAVLTIWLRSFEDFRFPDRTSERGKHLPDPRARPLLPDSELSEARFCRARAVAGSDSKASVALPRPGPRWARQETADRDRRIPPAQTALAAFAHRRVRRTSNFPFLPVPQGE